MVQSNDGAEKSPRGHRVLVHESGHEARRGRAVPRGPLVGGGGAPLGLGGAGAGRGPPTRSPRHPPACGTRGSARRPPAWRHPPVTAGSLNWGVSAAVSARDEDVGHFDIPDPMEESTASLVSSSTSAYASFPVDVVVYVRVQVSAECVRFPERGSLQRSSLGSLGRVCLSRLGGRQDPRQGYVQLHVCISAEKVHRALGFQNSNPIHLWQKL